MSKRLKKLGISTELKIDTESIIQRANTQLGNIAVPKNEFRGYRKIAVIAAVIAIMCIVTALAADNIISYFSDSKAKKVGDIDVLTQYNESIGKTVSENGKTFTLDNLATDDSYLYVFFTLTAPDSEYNIECFINGERIRNWTSWDNYMIDEYTGKGVIKASVADMEIPEKFDFEIYCMDPLVYDSYAIDDDFYSKLCESDEDILRISTTTSKAQIKTGSFVKTVDKYIPAINSTIEKVIISPFGSQLVVTQHEINRQYMYDRFAVLDENGEFINMHHEISRIFEDGDTEETRTVPIFLNGRVPESITIIPYGEKPEIEDIIGSDAYPVKNFPVEIDMSGRGKVIITDVRDLDSRIEIDYRLEGNTYSLDMIYPVTNEGKSEMRSSDGVWWLNETEYHQSTESFTEIFEFVIGNADRNGNTVSAGELRSSSILRDMFPAVKISYQSNTPELDYDNAVTIDLR